MGKRKRTRLTSWYRWAMLVVALVILAVFGWQWVTVDDNRLSPPLNPVIGAGTPSVTILPEPEVTPTTPAKSARPTQPRSQPFMPERISIEQIGARTAQALPRISVGENGFTLPDPLNANPTDYAWDREGAKAGAKRGAFNLLAHTYPPGQSALGNQLFDVLQVGDVIVVSGASNTLRYQVTERLQVDVADYPQQRVLDTTSPHVLTLTICSGERLGPGNWSMRTVWIATPMK